MNITYDYQIFAMQRFGGISRYFCELAVRLSQSDNVHLAAPLYVNEYISATNLRPHGFKIGPFKGAPRASTIASRYISDALHGRSRPEVVHETYYSRKQTFPRARRRVTTIHDMIPELFYARSELADRKRAAIARADAVICVSETTRIDLMERVRIDPSKVVVIPLAASLSKSTVVAPRPAHERPFILFVGLRDGYKNFQCLLRAFASTPRILREFDIVCFGGPPIRNDEYDLMVTLSIPLDRIVHVGGSDQLLAAYYRAAAVLVCPSLYEGFGLPVLEAMALDCPVCCSNAGSLKEVAGEAALYFDPLAPDSLAQKLQEFQIGDEMSSQLIVRGRQRAAKFNWDLTALSTRNLYKELM